MTIEWKKKRMLMVNRLQLENEMCSSNSSFSVRRIGNVIHLFDFDFLLVYCSNTPIYYTYIYSFTYDALFYDWIFSMMSFPQMTENGMNAILTWLFMLHRTKIIFRSAAKISGFLLPVNANARLKYMKQWYVAGIVA